MCVTPFLSASTTNITSQSNLAFSLLPSSLPLQKNTCLSFRRLSSSRYIMIPALLFKYKNMGIPPPLRSLMVIHPKLSPTVAAQLRLRGRLQSTSRGLITSSSSSAPSRNSHPLRRKLHNTLCRASSSATRAEAALPESGAATSSQSLEMKQEPRLQLTFTCTVEGCSERSTHDFTRRSYERGIVIVTCPGCKNR